MSKFIKKYSHKYQFLKLEFEETQEEFKEYEKIWESTFGKYFDKVKKEYWVNKDTGEMRDTPPGDNIAKKKEKPEKLKKLYRKVSIKAHPDKGGSLEDFNEIKDYYDSNDFMGLLNWATNNDITFEVSENEKELLEKSCSSFGNKIEGLKASIIWAYSTGDINMKRMCLIQIEKENNIKIKDEDLPVELVGKL